MELPLHDPDENASLTDLPDVPQALASTLSNHSFYPYPNHSSFRLGDWYWSNGVQKSQSSFKQLVDIITDPKFSTANVQNTGWDKINTILRGDNMEEWTDEDAGWVNSPFKITVPFQLRWGVTVDGGLTGPKEFTVPDFCHQNLVSVIREKLKHPTDSSHFHYEPYELHWWPGDGTHDARIYGKLYTSSAFINAHRKLQESAPEPGCDLPRVVVALMIWSDGTQLMSFGNANLWPLYLFFGNESKYQRSKPSNHLCCHVTYFQKVCFVYHCPLFVPNYMSLSSSLRTSRILQLSRQRAIMLQPRRFWHFAPGNSFTHSGKSYSMRSFLRPGCMELRWNVVMVSHDTSICIFLPTWLTIRTLTNVQINT